MSIKEALTHLMEVHLDQIANPNLNLKVHKLSIKVAEDRNQKVIRDQHPTVVSLDLVIFYSSILLKKIDMTKDLTTIYISKTTTLIEDIS